MTALNYLTIAEAAAAIRAGELTSVALTEACLARIEQTQEALSAFITVTAEVALEAARAADAARGEARGPLHGIPVALKDIYSTAGVRTTCHSRLLIDNVPAEDAVSVAKLKDAGAVLLGKLATHEFAFGGPSFDLPFPPARNPWHPEIIPGGSSSGSGAAVAAGLCAGALGSDTGGSIRNPAGFCGIVGLKPTYGRVSRRGVYPLSFSQDHAGPMTRTVEDCALMLQAIAGYDAGDPGSVDVPVPDFTAALGRPVRGLRIGVARQWYERPDGASPAMVASLDTMLETFRGLGAELVELDLPDIADFHACGRIIILAEGYAIHRATLAARPEAYGAFTRDRLRLGAFISAEQYIQAQRMRRALNESVTAAFRDCDVIVTANQYGPADRFTDASAIFPFFGKPYLTMPFNVTGHPAMTLPCGYVDDLPVGFQIAGRPFDEATVLQFGHAYEQARGDLHRRPPI